MQSSRGGMGGQEEEGTTKENRVLEEERKLERAHQKGRLYSACPMKDLAS